MPPRVSIVVPCFNESGRIGSLLQAVLEQDFPLEQLELIIADGGSTDGTLDEIKRFAQEHPALDIRLVPNPKRVIPAALNEAIRQSRGGTIIRLDAHSAPARNYVRRCLDTLASSGAANVGGVWEIQPGGSGWIARSIAAAAAHPLGAGDARYRISGEAGPVDTVPFGAFRRDWLEKIGPFNERLLTNEDYEYNVRIRAAGGEVWFDPQIRSLYIARATLVDLARQYWRYGFWKLRMLKRFPRTLRWRQALPPAFVLVSIGLALAAPLFILARWLLAVQLGAYAVVSFAAGIQQALDRRDPALVLGFPLALWTMHYAWGSGFLWSFIRDLSGGTPGGVERK